MHTGNQFASGTATMDLTKPGNLTKLELNSTSKHLKMMSDSKSRPEWLETELSTGTTRTLVTTNTNFSSEITFQEKTDNGSSSIAELNLSELTLRELTPFLTNSTMDSNMERML